MIAITAAEVFAAQGLGPNTPISGFTLASAGALFVAGTGFMWVGARMMLQIGGFIQTLKTTVETASGFGRQVVNLERRNSEHDRRLAELERWQARVDPLVSKE